MFNKIGNEIGNEIVPQHPNCDFEGKRNVGMNGSDDIVRWMKWSLLLDCTFLFCEIFWCDQKRLQHEKEVSSNNRDGHIECKIQILYLGTKVFL